MSALVRKHAKDILEYFAGADAFGFNEAALAGWAYPVDLEFTLQREQEHYSPKDESGLPVRVYRTAGLQYNPTRIAGYGLAHYNRLVSSGAEPSRIEFLRAADWFAAAPDGLWRYDFAWNDLRPGWLSCMAQGEGISVLVRASALTGEERYLARALQAAVPFRQTISAGGVRSLVAGRWPFLEEYPSSAPAHVLNGFLFAMNGIHDLMRLESDAGESVGFDELLESLERNLPSWDLGYWSAYDLAVGPASRRNVATVAYHRLHIAQLRYLGAVTHSRALVAMADHWTACAASLASRVRALTGKVLYRSLVRAQR